MTAVRFYCRHLGTCPVLIHLDAEESHHLMRVVRKQPGDTVEILDGQGRIAQGVVQRTMRNSASVEIHSMQMYESVHPEFHMAVALPRSEETFDMILKGCIQFSAAVFQPLFSSRSRKLNRSQIQRRLIRWKRIVVNSCKQCRQPWFPRILEPVEIDRYLDEPKAGDHLAFTGQEPGMTRQSSGPVPDIRFPSRIIWLVGPEGGWSEREWDLIRQSGFRSLQISPFVLTTEMACIGGMAVLMERYMESEPECSRPE
ncbi:16S rRNA (uracil(1498)-N(3))-methyltransferase [bacterium]|nr:16S rRNA (uracil(1498)-N(3))-methyltransferase [candidate division CSSED10-310 bacterium]